MLKQYFNGVFFFQVGLCHISELSDDHISNIETKYKAGERVAAKILKVNIFLVQKVLAHHLNQLCEWCIVFGNSFFKIMPIND